MTGRNSQILIFRVILFQDGTQEETRKIQVHDLKNSLRIYFLSGTGLHDRKT